jgi:hypothetical protein
LSGDTDISIQSGSNLTFSPSNWNSYQTVTLAAGDDLDDLNGTAIIRIDAPIIPYKDVTATEQDLGPTGDISLNPVPHEGTSGNIVEVYADVSGNMDSVGHFGFDFKYDNSKFNYLGLEADSLTQGWTINVSDVAAGEKRIDGFGSPVIPAFSAGSLVKITLQVRCLDPLIPENYSLELNDYTNDIAGFIPSPTSKDFNFSPCSSLGDVNADGNITPGDAQKAFEIFLGRHTPTFCQETISDSDCNEFTTPGDAQRIFEHFLGRTTLPECCAEFSNEKKAALSPEQLIDMNKTYEFERRLFPLNTIGVEGKTIAIPVIITNPAGIRSFTFDINYPAELLEYIGTNKSQLTSEFDYVIGIEETRGWIRVAGESSVPVSDFPFGSLAVLLFRVAKGFDEEMPLFVFNPGNDILYAELGEGTFVRTGEKEKDKNFLIVRKSAVQPDGTTRLSIRVSEKFRLKSFGMELKYDPDKMTFAGVRKVGLSENFISVDSYEPESGIVRVGGFGLSGSQKKGPGILIELIFSAYTGDGEIEIIRLEDDLQGFEMRERLIK